MKLLIVTSCTGQKTLESPRALTCEDFAQGADHIQMRERELADLLTPAQDLYSGQQHVRLMRGVDALAGKIDIALYVVSAGYGLVPGDRRLAPYECTFTGRSRADLYAWANTLGIPGAFRDLMAQPYDLCLLLLGNDYLAACGIDSRLQLASPTLALCGHNTAGDLPAIPRLKPVALGNPEAKRFSCGLVALKGDIAARLLTLLADRPEVLPTLSGPDTDVLGLLDLPNVRPTSRGHARSNPEVDRVIQLPESWYRKPHRAKLRYFIPEWDDLVDPDYDFENDVHSGGRGDWANEVYAHQMYPEPNYDGILVSRAVAEKSKKKDARINALGVHRYLRVPRDFPIMGDCGAFDYIEQDEPPYSTSDVIDYYSRLDFDYGVSVDHLVVPAFELQKHRRYELTIHNADEFLREHRKLGLKWEPIGAVQGWDPASYAAAVGKYQKMGYRSIALGGLVRSSTKEIVSVLECIKPVLKPSTRMHLFGIARPEALGRFADYGVTSVDSASHLRRAWLIARDNYFTLDGNSYSAIRIPDVDKSFRAKRIVKEGRATRERVQTLERRSIESLRAYDQGRVELQSVLDVTTEYDSLIGEGRRSMRDEYLRTLTEQPWKHCPCEICRRWGIEVMIFRGNNRNRRRGFHNTFVFYRLMQSTLNGVIQFPQEPEQLPLFKVAVGA